jgi:hypothetical protein
MRRGRKATLLVEHPRTGALVSLCDLAREVGIAAPAMRCRYQLGDRGERLLRPRGGAGGRPPLRGFDRCVRILERWAVGHYGAEAPHLCQERVA